MKLAEGATRQSESNNDQCIASPALGRSQPKGAKSVCSSGPSDTMELKHTSRVRYGTSSRNQMRASHLAVIIAVMAIPSAAIPSSPRVFSDAAGILPWTTA